MDITIEGMAALVVRDGSGWLGWVEAIGVSRTGETLEELVDELEDAVRLRRHKPLTHATVAARLGT